MFKKIFFSILFFSLISSVIAQSSLNDYKYIIVPDKYDFLKEADKYQLNSLSKFLFNKYGFIAIVDNEIFPDELARNSCLALKSNVIKERSALKTKLRIELKNCKEEVIYITKTGESREKKYKVAFNLALRDAFKSFETVNYVYQPNDEIIAFGNTSDDIKTNEEIKQLKDEIKLLKEDKKEIQTTDVNPLVAVVIPETKNTIVEPEDVIQKEPSNILYAQVINNGFQLVNNEPKVLYRIYKTGLNNVFLVEGKQAIIYQLDSKWILEYYGNDILKKEILNIKF